MSKNNQNGKGSNPRPIPNYSGYVDNFDSIKNFGFKPKWSQINLQKDALLKELVWTLAGEECAFYADKNTKFSQYDLYPDSPRRAKLFKKYNLDDSVKDLLLWEVVEKMYNFRPF